MNSQPLHPQTTRKAGRPKKCKACKCVFTPSRPLQAACSIQCAIDLSQKKKREKPVKREKTRQELIKLAQTVFNTYIRMRDDKLPCISCQRHHSGQYHAGHYRTTGSHPQLRFDELNVHKQCAPCNNHLSGNLIEYRKNLITKIGHDKLDWLEGSHDPKHYTIDELMTLSSAYRAKIKSVTVK